MRSEREEAIVQNTCSDEIFRLTLICVIFKDKYDHQEEERVELK